MGMTPQGVVTSALRHAVGADTAAIIGGHLVSEATPEDPVVRAVVGEFYKVDDATVLRVVVASAAAVDGEDVALSRHLVGLSRIVAATQVGDNRIVVHLDHQTATAIGVSQVHVWAAGGVIAHLV